MVKTNTIKEHKEVKNFNLNVTKALFKEKEKYEEKKHNRKIEEISHRGGVAIEVLEKRDENDENRHNRRVQFAAIK